MGGIASTTLLMIFNSRWTSCWRWNTLVFIHGVTM